MNEEEWIDNLNKQESWKGNTRNGGRGGTECIKWQEKSQSGWRPRETGEGSREWQKAREQRMWGRGDKEKTARQDGVWNTKKGKWSAGITNFFPLLFF